MPALLGLGTTFTHLRNTRATGEFAEGVAKPSAEAQAAAASGEEVAALSTRLKEALDLLKKSSARRRWGSGWLYQLPWYMFIGPPGSGKTTALTNSGLNFPLAEQLGKNAVRGVGGTRSCDWWFTDDAVLIDTAGRYTTQDSEAAVDAGAWTGFLKLLKKFRKRQPINGAIVAIGLLRSASPRARRSGSSTRRRSALRIKELYAELGVRFPIYVLFTKADLIAGFVEFFDDLGREEREQVWGMTFDVAKIDAEGGVVAAYPGEFDLLIGRLNDRLMERLQQEHGHPAPRAALRLPAAGRELQGDHRQLPARDLPAEPLRRPHAAARHLLHQRHAGRHADRPADGRDGGELRHLAAASHCVQRLGAQLFPRPGCMRNVIFGEAGLVSADAKLERRTRLIQYGVLGAAVAGVLLMTAGWITTYFNNSELIAAVNSAVDSYNTQAKNVSARPRLGQRPASRPAASRDPARHAGRLCASRRQRAASRKARPLPGRQARRAGDRGLSPRLGRILLPRMLIRLEGSSRRTRDRPDFLYEALKVYLMLGRQGKLDKQLIRRWMALDWAAQFPGPENEADLNALKGHLDAMLERPLPEIALNAGLVEQTPRVLLRVPLAERAYNLIKTHPKVTALPEWRISEHAGPAVARVLVRPSGRSLSEGIPGLYTHDGYFLTFRPLLPDISPRKSPRRAGSSGRRRRRPTTRSRWAGCSAT